MKKLLIIARYRESTDWIKQLPPAWDTIIVDKGRGELPNPLGREAHSHLHVITSIYGSIQPNDVFAFAQGHPFDHCPNYLADLDTKWVHGQIHSCNSRGLPHADYLDLDGFSRTFGLPVKQNYVFSGGTHFKVMGSQILAHSRSFYAALYELCKVDDPQIGNYNLGWITLCSLERLWGTIYQIPGLYENA
jgi:hypothetical protein